MDKTIYITFGTIALMLGLGVLLGVTPKLHAQERPVVTGPGSYINAGGSASLYQADYGQRDLGGVTAYIDANPTWRLGSESEARFLRYHQSEGVNETAFLAGPRISLRPGPLRPYVKLLAGAGIIELPFGYAHGVFLTAAPGAGVDYAINDRVTVRAVDFEYQLWTKFPYGALRPYGLSAGIAFRITGLFRTPTRGRW